MPDPGNPDQDPKPFKPDPKRRLFDPPSGEPRRDFAEPDPNYDPDKADQTHATDQETLFRAAAIRCHMLEDKLAALMVNSSTIQPSSDTFVNKYRGFNQVSSYDSSMLGVEGGQLEGAASIKFTDGISYFADKLGITTNRELEVGVYTDEETRDQFKELTKKDPKMASNFNTIYYFTANGDFRKISIVDSRSNIRIPDQQPLYSAQIATGYRSEMTQEDFEIAGRALQELIGKLNPQEGKPAD